MTKKKVFQIGDLVYFENYKTDIGIVVGSEFIDPIKTYNIFWFKTLKYGTHSDFYLHKLKRQQ